MRARRVRSLSLPQPTDPLWETVAKVTVAKDRLAASHRAAVLRSSGGKDPDRDPDQRHAAQRKLVQLAVYADAMNASYIFTRANI